MYAEIIFNNWPLDINQPCSKPAANPQQQQHKLKSKKNLPIKNMVKKYRPPEKIIATIFARVQQTEDAKIVSNVG